MKRRTQAKWICFRGGARSIRVGGKVSREKRIRTKGILLTRPYLRAYANAEQFATGICIDSGGDLYGIMSRHNLKTLCQLCTAFSSSHVSASSATPAFFFLFSKPFQTFLSRRWRYSTFANNSMKISLSRTNERRFFCSNKNVSVIIHGAWNARYVFGRLHRSSAPSYE